jgi:hypothetical protein
MKKTISTALASLFLVSTIAVPAVAAPKHRNYSKQDNYIRDYCRKHRDSSCNDWQRHHGSWDESHYHNWYNRHRSYYGSNNAAAAIFGFAAGAIAGAAVGAANGAASSSHVAACQAQYRSYNPQTDMYLGYDGQYHYCRL